GAMVAAPSLPARSHVTRYAIEITPTSRFILATVRGDFPGVDEGATQWQCVAEAARAHGVQRVMFVRYGGRPPDAVGFVDAVRRLESLGMRGWRVAIVFWDAERMVEEYQFVTSLARHLGIDLAVCETIAEAEGFLARPLPVGA